MNDADLFAFGPAFQACHFNYRIVVQLRLALEELTRRADELQEQALKQR